MQPQIAPIPKPHVDRSAVLSLQLTGFGYGTAQILGAIELKIQRGETVALVGPSGGGKSSILRICAGLEQPSGAKCRLRGRVSIVFQEPTLLPWRSLVENLTLTTGITRGAARDALAAVGLAGRENDFPGQMSLGQQRRLALARALAVRPDLLLLDEPFVSLDPQTTSDMMDLYDKLRDDYDLTTIIVTHAASEAERLATRIVTLGGSPAVITSDQNTGA
ncbi:hypothetical protein BVC71_03065 [Marivivens niveibacter]|uniref:ABC transporter domain-containing protein n=1 Tax=Marivivens niveibacter TaxID=1930667 RepID=A0A251X2V1_9RHOB|nr:ATP-binding cassette domain-containing protein [Marivivens niveibacter]OUD10493.1 hypothetical protein BVC71_03065 [Marivivens niveibacter]